jgi:hypothetical protein
MEQTVVLDLWLYSAILTRIVALQGPPLPIDVISEYPRPRFLVLATTLAKTQNTHSFVYL